MPSPPLIALLAAQLDTAEVRQSLRHDALNVVLGIGLIGLALGAVLLFRLRTGTRDRTLLSFGWFAGLYGLRLLLDTRVVPFLADPVPRDLWRYAVAWISYTIPIPALLFVIQLFPARRRVLQWILWGSLTVAVPGVFIDLIFRRPESLALAGHIFAIAFLGVVVFESWREGARGGGLGMVKAALIVFMITVFINNSAGLGFFRQPFNPEPLGFACFVASVGQLAVRRALDRDNKLVGIENELGLARRIQASILPARMPDNQHVRIAARYVPMTEVAGDLYDFLIMDERRLGVLIADVSGHGVPAALIASMVKIAVSAQLPHAHDPGAVLSGINRALAGKFKGQFVTAAYLFLDLEANRLRYATAGHPPVLWQHGGSGAVEPLSQKGLALSLSARSEYGNLERELHGGDRFLLYTDGLFEARNPAGNFYGEERIASLMAGNTGTTTDQFADTLLSDLREWARYDHNRSPEDDLTLVVVDVA